MAPKAIRGKARRAKLGLGHRHQVPAQTLGKADAVFQRKAGAPLDNNLCERALKKAIRHRKNSLFYRTQNGARIGDMFMSLIHTCELNKVNPFDYLTDLLSHPGDVAAHPEKFMPWNYRQTLAAP